MHFKGRLFSKFVYLAEISCKLLGVLLLPLSAQAIEPSAYQLATLNQGSGIYLTKLSPTKDWQFESSTSDRDNCPIEIRGQAIESQDTYGLVIHAFNRQLYPVIIRALREGKEPVTTNLFPGSTTHLFWPLEEPMEDALKRPTWQTPIVVQMENGREVCRLTATMKRTASETIIQEKKSRHNIFANLLAGSSLTRSGGLSSLGPSQGFAGGLEVGSYFGGNFGFTLSVLFENYGGGNDALKSRLKSERGYISPEARLVNFGIMASYRRDLPMLGSGRWDCNYDFGLNLADHQYGDTTRERLSENAYVYGLAHKFTLSREITTWRTDHGFSTAAFRLGLSVYHNYSPSGTLVGQDLSGHSLGALIVAKFTR